MWGIGGIVIRGGREYCSQIVHDKDYADKFQLPCLLMLILQSLEEISFCLEEFSVAVNYLSLDKRSYQSYAAVVFAASNTSFLLPFSFIVFGDGLFKLVWTVAASSSSVQYSNSM
jgi:hypothetical protein